MKLVIDIPEDVVADVKDTYTGDDVLYCAVKYGTPLEEYEDIFAEGLLDGFKASIKAEIKRRADKLEDDRWYERGTYYECLDIIDKYKGAGEC